MEFKIYNRFDEKNFCFDVVIFWIYIVKQEINFQVINTLLQGNYFLSRWSYEYVNNGTGELCFFLKLTYSLW